MADLFRTGRSRRCTLSWHFETEAAYRALQPVGEGYTGGTGFAVSWLGFEVWAGSPADVCGRSSTGAPPNGFLLPISGGPPELTWVVQLRLPGDPDTGYGGYFNQHGPWGGAGREIPVAAYKPLGMPGVPPGERFAVFGSVELWMDLEEWKAIEIDTRTPRVPLHYPTSGKGPPDDDFVGLCTLHYYEGPKRGGEFGFRITIVGGLGCSGTADISNAIVGPNVLAHTPTVRVFAAPCAAEGFRGVVSNMRLGNLPVGFDRLDCRQPHYSCSGSSQGSLTALVQAHAAGPYLATCDCAPDTTLRVDGVTTKVFAANYGATVRYRRSWAVPPEVDKPYGIYAGVTETYSEQRAVIERCDHGSATLLCEVSVPKPDLFLWLDNSWLVQNGEMPKDWRILIADDYCWAPFELSHTARTTLDDFDSTAGWEATNATVSSSGGVLRVVARAGGGNIRKHFARDSSQYRKLRLTARSNPPAACRVRLNDSDLYVWDIPLGTTFRDYVLDLCIPQGASALYDDTDSSHVPPGHYYGPRTIETVSLENLAGGTTYAFADLSFVRTGQASLTALPPFDESILGSDGVRRYRLCWGLCEGRQILDMPYRVEDAQGDRFLSVARFIEALAQHDACDIRVPSPPGSDERTRYYFDHSRRLAAFMASEWYPTGGRENLLDVSIVGRAPIRWLQRYDKVGIYPGIGDPAGSFGGPYPLRFTKRLRTMCHGTTVDPDTDLPVKGALVTLYRNGVTYATAISGEEGYYRLGPFPPSEASWSAGTARSGPVPLATGLTNRKFRWLSLAASPVASVLSASLTRNETGRTFLAYVGPAGAILRRIEADERSEELLIEAGYQRTGFAICWTHDGSLHFVYERGEGIGRKVSTDEGKSWEEKAMIVSSGTHPNLTGDAATGLLFAFWHDGTGIRCRRSSDGGTTWSEEVIVAAQCPPQTCGVTIRPDGRNTLLVAYVDASGAARLLRSWDNARTWQE